MVFAITNKEVEEQAQLFGFYGRSYGDTMKKCDEYKANKKLIEAKQMLDEFARKECESNIVMNNIL